MCLIALAWRADPDYPLIVAANRDEFRARAVAPVDWWPDGGILAGRDLEAGGTWMGVSHAGRFAAVTNLRQRGAHRAAARSRGLLVTDFLRSAAPVADFLAELAAHAADYSGFNLVVFDGAELGYLGSQDGAGRAITPGVHGLANAALDEPWPKVERARAGMAAALGAPTPDAALFGVLADPAPAPDAALPDTGVGVELERRLSAPLITGPDYGTRASTVLTLSRRGAITYEERSLDAAGAVQARRRFEFAADLRTAG